MDETKRDLNAWLFAKTPDGQVVFNAVHSGRPGNFFQWDGEGMIGYGDINGMFDAAKRVMVDTPNAIVSGYYLPEFSAYIQK